MAKAVKEPSKITLDEISTHYPDDYVAMFGGMEGCESNEVRTPSEARLLSIDEPSPRRGQISDALGTTGHHLRHH